MIRAALSTLRSDGVANGWTQTRIVGLLATVAGGAQVIVGTFVLPTDAGTVVVAWGGMMLAVLGANLLRYDRAVPTDENGFGRMGTAIWTLGTAVIVLAALVLVLPV